MLPGWRILPEDDREMALLLRAYGKARAGKAINERERLALVRFVRKIDAADAVVDHDPADHAEPFKLVQRRPDDTEFVHRHQMA